MAGAADGSAEAERPGRLSGLVPLVVMAVIAFLFVRSCLAHASHRLGLDAGDDEEYRELPGTVTVAPDEPARPAEPDDITSGEEDLPAEPDPELAALLKPWDPRCPDDAVDGERHLQWTAPPAMCIDPEASYIAVVETNLGPIEIELDAASTPRNVNNLLFLAGWHFYSGLGFDRVYPGNSIQAGFPAGPDQGPWGPGYRVADELPATDDRPWYPRYSVIMANLGQPDTNGSVFAIVTADRLPMDRPYYTRIGHVTDPDSQLVVNAIDATGTADSGSEDYGTPSTPTIIRAVTVTEQ